MNTVIRLRSLADSRAAHAQTMGGLAEKNFWEMKAIKENFQGYTVLITC